jgi:hypothetical protein
MNPYQLINQLCTATSVLGIMCIGFACGARDGSGGAGQKGFFLEKVDSITVYRETELRMLDYHPEKQQFLAVDIVTEEFLLIDMRGEVLEQIYRRGEGPNEYNSDLLAVGFNLENGGYLAQNSIEQIRFDETWEVEERIRFASYSGIFFYSGPRMKVPYYRLSEDSGLYFFTNFFTGVNNGVGGEVPTEIAANLIEQYNPGKGDLEWVMRHDKELLPEFELDDKQKDQPPTQVYSLNRKQGKLYLTFDRSTEIGEYDLTKDFELIGKTSFSHETFSAAQNAKNVGLFEFGNEMFGVLYYQGLSEAASSTRRESDPDYFPFLDARLYSFILLHKGDMQGEEIPFPESCDPRAEMLSLPGNRLLLREKYRGDVEPEHFKYFIYELKSKG